MATDSRLPETIILLDQWQGDTFCGYEFTVTKNGVAKSLAGATITATFLLLNRRTVSQQVLTNGSGITITDASNGVFEMDEFTPFNWDAGDYKYDIEIKYADGEIKTPIKGTLKVVADKTNNS